MKKQKEAEEAKTKVTKKRKPLQDIIVMKDLENIMDLIKNSKTTNKPFIRIAIVLLFLLGIRITEIKQIQIGGGVFNTTLMGEPLYVQPSKTKTPINIKMAHYCTDVKDI